MEQALIELAQALAHDLDAQRAPTSAADGKATTDGHAVNRRETA
jgi:hypothetical protein